MTMEPESWTGRTWSFGLPARRLASVLERVRGTPARAEELVARVPEEALSARVGSRWSAKEHIAHLDDLHELDETRLAEFASGAEALTAADMKNTRTETARHNETGMRDVTTRFRSHRAELVEKLESLSEDTHDVYCMHPRLGQRLRLVDWVYFVAEHDDHHLVLARRALER